MSILTLQDTQDYLHFDEEQCRAAGRALADRYQSAKPFPHITIDELLDPALLRALVREFPSTDGKNFFDRDQERLKFQFRPHEIAGPHLRNFLMELNSNALLGFMEEMTGITGLIPDPYYLGGGLHETKAGGRLGIHADFNVHKMMKLERRLNLLIYLNDDWPESYGGNLELWDQKMRRRQVSISPVIGRAVLFNTSLDSFHGQPEPVTCPPDRARRSIATYYYTVPRGGIEILPDRTTNFRTRPGSMDRPDRRVAFDRFLKDWVPPRLYRTATKLNPFK
jgi:Rps23 Pro-64 3,4-dihydroxylase Tpa1-like proline 4-hydroxylase